MNLNKRIALAVIAGFFVGALWLVALRFITFKDTRVHFHANFALYINGQRDTFDSSTFYEETQACSADEVGPKSRVHMHDKKSHIVHVHNDGATWGHFFANLGYGLSNKSVTTDSEVFVDGKDGVEINYILNDKPADSVSNLVIESEDVLVIDVVKNEDGVITSRIAPEPPTKDAAEYNSKSDPSACSGSKPVTFTERLKKSIGINN